MRAPSPNRAALGDARKTLTFRLVNPSDSKQPMELAIHNVKLMANRELWRMAPKRVDATIVVGHIPGVAAQQQELSPLPDSIVVPPFSVTTYSFPVQ